MERLLGAAAAILTWLGWLAICPALGFPVLGTAQMINRAIFRFNPEAGHEPNFWVGWSILIVALVGAIAVFFLLEKVRLVRASIRTGVIYGAALWLVAGFVVMPLLGLVGPPPANFPGQPPDPMQATAMMYTLGPLASVAALIAWVLFGAILGATSSAQNRREIAKARSPSTMKRRWWAPMLGVVSLALVCAAALPVHAKYSASSDVAVKTLAQGHVKALPAGKVFINILEFRQLPGADFGPQSHIPVMVYTVQGVSTISFPGAPSRSAGPGEAVFIPAQVVHTHQNLDGRFGATTIAVGLIVVVILLCAATWLRGGSRRVAIAVLSVSLVGIGALPLAGATVDDYYLIAVRPVAQRVLPMPRPDGRVEFTAPDVDPMPAAPYIETLSMITVPAGGHYVAPVVAGPQLLAVVQGSASIDVGSGTQQVGTGDGAFAQMGETVSIANPGSTTLHVLDFAVTSAP